jgi:hypothetical protein
MVAPAAKVQRLARTALVAPAAPASAPPRAALVVAQTTAVVVAAAAREVALVALAGRVSRLL